MKKQNLISKLTTSCLTNEVVNTITEDANYNLNHYFGNTNIYFDQTMEYIETQTNLFKANLFVAIKEIFNRKELIILQKSNTDSRNYLIAYNKLFKHFSSKLTQEDKLNVYMSTDEMFAMLFEYMSSGYEELTDPQAHKYVTSSEKARFLKDYNAISEMFIK